jgi:rod shape-determining protein MreD
MVRSALASKKIGHGPLPGAGYIPAASVVLASLLSALPIIVESGWYPDFGFLVLIAWRLRRADVWPSWWAAPLGFANDLLAGSPIGLSVTIWTFAMLALDLVDRRTIWRDYWIEWILAALLILLDEAAQWMVAAWVGARISFAFVLPAIFISIASFPVAAWFVGRLDHWRLGRQ